MNAPPPAATPLEPCPWCGKTPDVDNPLSFWTDGKWGAVQCCCIGPDVRTGYYPLEEWKADAIAAWNDRVESTALATAAQREQELRDTIYARDRLIGRLSEQLATAAARIATLEAELADTEMQLARASMIIMGEEREEGDDE